MTRVLVVAHHERDEAAVLASQASTWLHARGHEAWMTSGDATALGLESLADDQPAMSADLVLSLGGDGTMLRAVQMLNGAPVPIIGVNVGLLGYLAEVEPAGMIGAIERFVAGDDGGEPSFRIDERMMIDIVLLRADHTTSTWRALNEGVLEKEEPGHTIRMLVRIDGEPFTSYAADGLIASTPTGSTAYSLSARGPVVSPRHRALLLTPVSPHMLFDRTLVLDPEEAVEVELTGHRGAVLSVDGRRTASVAQGETVSFTTSAATARFVRFGERRFHQILKSKFGLSDR
jgi:NAD+ kinase